MAKTIVRYKVKPGLVEENEKLVRAVYGELAKVKPAHFSYATYKLDDGLSFVHIAEFTGEGKGPLAGIAAFAEFQQGVKNRCDELPVVSQGTEIGSYQAALVLQD
jgi:hypothetical protein